MNKKLLTVILLALFPSLMWGLDSSEASEVVDNYFNSLQMYAESPDSNPRLVTRWFTADNDNVVFNDIYGAEMNDYSIHNRCSIKDYITYVGGYYNSYRAKLSITHKIMDVVENTTTYNGKRTTEYLVYVSKTIVGNGTKKLNFTTYEEIAVREVSGNPEMKGQIYRIVQTSNPFATSPINTTTESQVTINSTKVLNDPSGNFGADMKSALYAYEMRWLRIQASITNHGEAIDVELALRLYSPNGTLRQGSTSPEGYTSKNKLTLSNGTKNYYLFSWGNKQSSVYAPGTYRYEVYYRDQLLHSGTFTIQKDKWYELLEHNILKMTNNKYDTGIYPSTSTDYGIYIFSTGSIYIGKMNSSGTFSGNNILIIISPDRTLWNCDYTQYYNGPYSGGHKTGGIGSCYDANGKLLYKGSFADDKPAETYPMQSSNSQYKFECQDKGHGDYYIGETKNGIPHGWGVYAWKSGDLWYGRWENNQRTTQGKFFQASSGSTQTGEDIYYANVSVKAADKEEKIYVKADGQSDYIYKGTGEWNEQKIPVGNYYVKRIRENWEDRIDYVTVKYPSTTLTLPPMKAKTGTLYVTSQPAGARVYIDGNYSGNTPLTKELTIGSHNVSAQKERRVPSDIKKVTITKGMRTSTEFRLKSQWYHGYDDHPDHYLETTYGLDFSQNTFGHFVGLRYGWIPKRFGLDVAPMYGINSQELSLTIGPTFRLTSFNSPLSLQLALGGGAMYRFTDNHITWVADAGLRFGFQEKYQDQAFAWWSFTLGARYYDNRFIPTASISLMPLRVVTLMAKKKESFPCIYTEMQSGYELSSRQWMLGGTFQYIRSHLGLGTGFMVGFDGGWGVTAGPVIRMTPDKTVLDLRLYQGFGYGDFANSGFVAETGLRFGFGYDLPYWGLWSFNLGCIYGSGNVAVTFGVSLPIVSLIGTAGLSALWWW